MNTYKALPFATKKENSFSFFCELLLVIGAFAALLAFPDATRNAVNRSLNTCITLIIPSIFPFAVLGEIFFSCGCAELVGKLIGKPFSRVLAISESGVSVFLLGAVCGLPLGGKYALTLYSNGIISKEECERLMGISSNAGLGFVVAGVGGGIWGSIRLGWLIYLCQIISALLLACITFRPQKTLSIAPAITKTKKKSFLIALVESVPAAAFNMLRICSFVVVFGIISTFISSACAKLSLPPIFATVLSALTEISQGCVSLHVFSLTGAIELAKSLTFFTVGFSGFCVHAQLSSMASEVNVGMKKYYCIRLCCGILTAILGNIALKFAPALF